MNSQRLSKSLALLLRSGGTPAGTEQRNADKNHWRGAGVRGRHVLPREQIVLFAGGNGKPGRSLLPIRRRVPDVPDPTTPGRRRHHVRCRRGRSRCLALG